MNLIFTIISMSEKFTWGYNLFKIYLGPLYKLSRGDEKVDEAM